MADFKRTLHSIPATEVNFGSGGLHLYGPDEIDAGQIGYAVASDGSSLCTGEKGAWRPEWTVIGYDTASGDPLIMDCSDAGLPILWDLNGQGKWEPVKIAISLETFLAQFREFARLAEGRSTPIELEANPVSHNEEFGFLTRISQLNQGQTGLDFWKARLEG
jgi:hypothetical protein